MLAAGFRGRACERIAAVEWALHSNGRIVGNSGRSVGAGRCHGVDGGRSGGECGRTAYPCDLASATSPVVVGGVRLVRDCEQLGRLGALAGRGLRVVQPPGTGFCVTHLPGTGFAGAITA